MRRTLQQVIHEIESFLSCLGGPYDWDDFVTLPIKNDPRLDAVRVECYELRETFPPGRKRQYCNDEGLRRLEEILRDLKAQQANATAQGSQGG